MAKIIFSPPGVPPAKQSLYANRGFKFRPRGLIVRLGQHARRHRAMTNPRWVIASWVLNGVLSGMVMYLLYQRG